MTPKFDPDIHHRRSIRLKGFDYTAPGAYFVTLVASQHQCLFGEVQDGRMWLNIYGEIVMQVWVGLPGHYPHVALGEMCIMPNHVHAIIILTDNDERRGGSDKGSETAAMLAKVAAAPGTNPRQTRPYRRHALPEIVRAWKSFSARAINYYRKTSGLPVWQRNYYEHIIRSAE